MRFLILAVMLFAGCNKTNPNFCEGAELDNCTLVDGPPGGQDCEKSADCPDNAAPVCDLDRDMPVCVPCTGQEIGACTDTTPVCNDATNTCVACTVHADCPDSLACLPDGACADPLTVAYVSNTGEATEAACAKATPCKTLGKALMAGKAIIKIDATTISEPLPATLSSNLTILADPGATIDRIGDGPAILATAGTSQIFDLTITGSSGAVGIGVGVSMPSTSTANLTLKRMAVHTNASLGIQADAGQLTISQSKIFLNAGGAIRISQSRFDISNTWIFENGGPGLNANGGVTLIQTNDDPRRFEFNTVASNSNGRNNGISGVECAVVDMGVTFASNIIFGNTTGTGTPIQVGGDSDCAFEFSNIGPQNAGGTMNFVEDPLFVEPGVMNDYHLMAGSPAIDKAKPGSTVTDDIDGEATRPTGSGDLRDVGADERP
ncbi:MAG: choice-of-anchor Q domain-containing protein [Kofleriaceae bacterium]